MCVCVYIGVNVGLCLVKCILFYVHYTLSHSEFASRAMYTVTNTTIAPSYQLTPGDVASLKSQIHGELNRSVVKPPNDTQIHQPHVTLFENLQRHGVTKSEVLTCPTHAHTLETPLL